MPDFERLVAEAIRHTGKTDSWTASRKPLQSGHEGKLRVVGAVYSLDTGRVEWLPAGPSR